MVDLPAIIDRLRKRRAMERLERIQDMQIAFGRYEEKDAKRMINDLIRETGAVVNNGNKFDRAAFERLRALTAKGANRA